MVVENAVSGTAPESPISVQLGWDLVSDWHTHTFNPLQHASLRPLFFKVTEIYSSSHGSQNNGQLCIFIHDPKHDGMWIKQWTPEPHLCGSIFFQYTSDPSFTQMFPFILAVTCLSKLTIPSMHSVWPYLALYTVYIQPCFLLVLFS